MHHATDAAATLATQPSNGSATYHIRSFSLMVFALLSVFWLIMSQRTSDLQHLFPTSNPENGRLTFLETTKHDGVYQFDQFATNTPATECLACTVKLWDIEAEENLTADVHGDQICSLSCCREGDQSVTVCSDKTIGVVDARTNSVLAEAKGLLVDKAQSAFWAMCENKIISTGSTRFGTVLCVWDPRKMDKAVQELELDPASGVVLALFGDGTGRKGASRVPTFIGEQGLPPPCWTLEVISSIQCYTNGVQGMGTSWSADGGKTDWADRLDADGDVRFFQPEDLPRLGPQTEATTAIDSAPRRSSAVSFCAGHSDALKESLASSSVLRRGKGPNYDLIRCPPSRLQLFGNQVAGRHIMLTTSDGRLCKDASRSQQELRFYTTMHQHPSHPLHEFLPKYYGHFLISACDLVQQCPRVKEVLQRRPGHSSLRFVALQDVTHGMARPCLVDVKMGRQQHTPGAHNSESKMRKSRETTSATLGFRLCGMQLYQGAQYTRQDKYQCRRHTKEQMQAILEAFFGHQSPGGLRLDAVQTILWGLQRLERVMATQRDWLFFTSSLVLAYDASPGSPAPARVALVDFGHTVPAAGGLDGNFLEGLRNLVALLRCVSDRTEYCPPPDLSEGHGTA